MRKTGVEVRGGVRGDLLAHPAPFDHVRRGDVAAKQNVTLFHAMVFTIVSLSSLNCTHVQSTINQNDLHNHTNARTRQQHINYTITQLYTIARTRQQNATSTCAPPPPPPAPPCAGRSSSSAPARWGLGVGGWGLGFEV